MKRPLCTFCTLFLIIQAARTALFLQADGDNLSGTAAVLADGSRQIVLTGTVERMDEKKKVNAVFLTDNHISIADREIGESKVLVYVRPDQTKSRIRAGNRLRISGQAEIFEEARNPGNFDQKFYYRKQDIHFFVWAENIEIISAKTDRIKDFLQRLRSGWKDTLTAHLGEYYGNTMSAVLLGEKGGLDEEMKKLYQKNGIGHILAISGLHMSFIGSGIYGMLRKAGLSFAVAGLCGGGILSFYTLMIGGSVSAVRALLMFLIRAGADVAGRDYDLPTSLAASAAVTGAWQPLYLMDAAYQLSYGAILGIALLTPLFEDMMAGQKSVRPDSPKKTKKKGIKGKIAGRTAALAQQLTAGVAASLSVSIFLMGPLLYFYFEIPPYSTVLNLAVIPAMSLVMGAGLLGSVLTLLWDGLGGMVLTICKAVLAAYDGICATAGYLPGSRFVTGQPSSLWLAVYYCGLFLVYLVYRCIRHCRKKRAAEGIPEPEERSWAARLPGAVLLCFAAFMAAACRWDSCHMNGIQITVLDVGQGDGIFVRSCSGKSYFVDGGSSDVSSPGTYRIEPFLLASGAGSLEYVFLTHGDADHINGMEEMLEDQELGIRIKNLVLPPKPYIDEKLSRIAGIARKNGTRVITMEPGDRICEEGTGQKFGLTCLAPDHSLPDGTEGNAASMVLELSYGDFSMLLTGDLEKDGEKSLVESGNLKQCTVLKAAHHGSGSSGTEDFLDIVRPSCAIISAGRDNRYGHPHPETLERLEKAGCTVYSTQDFGAVSVWTDGSRVKITGFHSPPADGRKKGF